MKKYNSFIESLNEYQKYDNDDIYMLESIIMANVNYLDVDIKTEIFESWEMLNEGFADKIKDKANQFRQKVFKLQDKLGDVAKDAWDKIKKNAKVAVEIIKNVISKIKEFWNKTKDYAINKLVDTIVNLYTFKEKVKEIEATDVTKIHVEFKNLKDVMSWLDKEFMNGFISSIKNALLGLFTKKAEHVELATEQLNFLLENDEHSDVSKPLEFFKNLMKLVEKIPPFSWLSILASNIEKNIGKVIENLSSMIEQMGGPKIAIPTIIGLISIGVEYGIKSVSKHVIVSFAAPGLETVLVSIGLVASVIASIHAIDKTFNGKILGH